MARELIIDAIVDSAQAANSLGQLEGSLEALKNELRGVEVGSEAFKELQNEIFKTESRIKNIDSAVEGLDFEQKFTAIGDVAGGVASGLAAAQGAMIAFGGASEATQKQMEKFFALLAFAEVASQIGSMVKGFKDLRKWIISATVGMKGLRAAIATTGIGLLVVGIGALANSLSGAADDTEDLAESTDDLTKAQESLKDSIESSNSALKSERDAMSEVLRLRKQLIDTEKQVIQNNKARINVNSRISAIMKERNLQDEERKELLEELKGEIKERLNLVDQEFDAANSLSDAAKFRIAQIKNETQSLKEQKAQVEETLRMAKANEAFAATFGANAADGINKIENSIKRLNSEISDLNFEFDGYMKKNYIEELQKDIDDAQPIIDDFVRKHDSWAKRLQQVQEAIDDLGPSEKELQKQREEASRALERRIQKEREYQDLLDDLGFQRMRNAINADEQISESRRQLQLQILQIEQTFNQRLKEINRNEVADEELKNQMILAAEKEKNLAIENANEEQREKEAEAEQERINERLKKQKEAAEKELDILIRTRLAADRKELALAERNNQELLELRIKLIKDQAQADLMNTELVEEERKEIIAQAERDIFNLRKDFRERTLQEQLDQFNFFSNQVQSIITSLGTFIDAQRSRELQRFEQRVNREIELTEEGTDTRRSLEEAYANEREEIERRYANQQKSIKTGLAVINGAVAATNALATVVPTVPNGVVAAIAVGIETAAQIAAIQAEQFARGGILKGPSHAAGGISTSFGELEGNEIILNKNVTASPTLRTLASDINALTGGVRFSDDTILGEGTMKSLRPAVKKQQEQVPMRAYVVERDISKSQDKASKLKRRSEIGF